MNNQEFRAVVPIAKGQPDFSLPNFETEFIKNHKIYFIEDRTQPLVSIKFLFKIGSYHEKIDGLAHFTAQMLTLGNSKMNAEQINEKIDYFGAQLSSASYWDELVTSINMLQNHTDELLKLLLDCITSPTLQQSEIDRLKKRQISYIQQQNADPSYVAQIAFNEQYYHGTNYAHARIGNEQSIIRITKEDIIDYYQQLIKSDYAILVSRNYDIHAVLKALDQYLTAPDNENTANNEYHNIEPRSSVILIDKTDATQATFRLGKPSIKRTSPDFPAFITANTIFGGFFLSRLNENLREKQGLTYGISSYNDARRYSSTLVIATNINEENSKRALDEIYKELDKFNKEPCTTEELNRAIQYMLGSFARGMENHRQISSLVQTLESYSLPTSYYQEIYSKIATLDNETVFMAQKKYFSSDGIMAIVCGNKTRLEQIFHA